MGVFSRPDSPYWWLYLETIQRREKTKIKVGQTTAQRHDSRKLADELYHRRMNDLAIDAHDLPRQKPPIVFQEFATWYDTHVVSHRRGAEREREILKTLTGAFGPRQLREIDRADVLEWRSARAVKTSASTSNRELDVLKHLLTTAVPKYLEASPAKGMKRLRAQQAEAYILTHDEERRLLRTLDAADRALVICALDTLMRLSDVVNLRRDQDRRTYLVVEDPKIKPYRVPISSRLRKALDGLPKTSPYYFSHRRCAEKPRDYKSSVKSMLKRACSRAHIAYGRGKGITFHSLRHTGATRLVDAGVSIRVIQELGGWQSLRQLERYTHPSEATKAAAVELIGSRPLPEKAKGRRKTSKRRAAA